MNLDTVLVCHPRGRESIRNEGRQTE